MSRKRRPGWDKRRPGWDRAAGVAELWTFEFGAIDDAEPLFAFSECVRDAIDGYKRHDSDSPFLRQPRCYHEDSAADF